MNAYQGGIGLANQTGVTWSANQVMFLNVPVFPTQNNSQTNSFRIVNARVNTTGAATITATVSASTVQMPTGINLPGSVFKYGLRSVDGRCGYRFERYQCQRDHGYRRFALQRHRDQQCQYFAQQGQPRHLDVLSRSSPALLRRPSCRSATTAMVQDMWLALRHRPLQATPSGQYTRTVGGVTWTRDEFQLRIQLRHTRPCNRRHKTRAKLTSAPV